MIFAHVHSILSLSIALIFSGCKPITFDCGGPSYRWANSMAAIADAADTLKAAVFVGVSEQRGGGQANMHSLSINVEALPRRNTVLPLPSLFGHAIGARLERADGSLLVQLPLHTESLSVGLIAIMIAEGIPQSTFDMVRTELLANRVYVKVVFDSSVPEMARGVTQVVESHDWAKQGCQ